jgi:hypothetical protein
MARPKAKKHVLTQEQYAQQAREFGFLAVVHFWQHLTANAQPHELKERGDAYLQRVAAMIADELEGQPITPYMSEALQFAGLYVRKEWLH